MSNRFLYLWVVAAMIAAGLTNCSSPEKPAITENRFDTLSFGSFVESGFPFISTYLDARNLGARFPDDNVVARGLVIQLGDSAYACFDRDLLRWSVAWTGKMLTESMLPEVSYNDFFNKKNSVPLVAGEPDVANGIYPGWSVGNPVLKEVRPKEQYREGFSWGPLPPEYGRWKGSYVYGDRVVLSYSVSDINIFEMPDYIRWKDTPIYTRTLDMTGASDTLFLNAAEVIGGTDSFSGGKTAYIYYGEEKDSVTAVRVRGDNPDAGVSVRIKDQRYINVVFPPSEEQREATVFLWRGRAEDLDVINQVIDSSVIEMPEFDAGGPSHWEGRVATKGKIAPDTAAFVTDLLTLPVPNPWKRNVRVTDLAFLDEDKAVVSTFAGDIWLVKGIKDSLKNLSWKRFASGLYEPMSIAVYESEIYVFGKEGIVRLHDLNGDNEADYYENFSDLMQQSAESYEWAADMIITEDKYITIAKGGALTARPGITKPMIPGFRAGSNHSGTIMRISLDGKQAEVISTGFRAPFLGLHPTNGTLTATDQQGNYVPSTPIYVVEKGDYFGVPATSHRMDDPETKHPLTWIPHRIDRSAGSQIWITSGKMGPLNNSLVHFSFGRPGLFRVLIDSTSQGLQGAVAFINSNYPVPVLKGAIGPGDGQLYMAGFNLFGSSSEGISAIQRLRYTGKASYLPNRFEAGTQGVIISFDRELESEKAIDPSSYKVKRWNYKRTDKYGSGHFRLDGTPGEEILPVLAAYLSADHKSVLLLIPDMAQVDQMEVSYKLRARDGKKLDDGIWFSVNYAEELDLEGRGFKNVDLDMLKLDPDQIESMTKYDPPITRERGRALFVDKGCAGCHSPGTKTAGMYGPPFKGLYGSDREMKDGSIVVADDEYLKESIFEPEKKITKGYEAEMPSFQGILTDADVEALLLYIKYLKF